MGDQRSQSVQDRVSVRYLELAINVIYLGRDGVERIVASYDKEVNVGWVEQNRNLVPSSKLNYKRIKSWAKQVEHYWGKEIEI